MALISIIANSNNDIDWETFLVDYKKLNIRNVEVFPIPKQLGFDADSVGINVHHGYKDKDIVLFELEVLISFFSLNKSYDFKFIELYDGTEIIHNQISQLMSKLLP